MKKSKLHIEYTANGCGAQSMLCAIKAGQGKLPGRVWITADTGEENNRKLNSGELISTAQYFKEVVQPLAKLYGCEAYFVRTLDGQGQPLPRLLEWHRGMMNADRMQGFKMPMYGDQGGRLRQSCTYWWKIMAINQQLRRLGATSARGAQGIHAGEPHRVKGDWVGDFIYDGHSFSYYRTPSGQKKFYHPTAGSEMYVQHGERIPLAKASKDLKGIIAGLLRRRVGRLETIPIYTKWLTHFYALVDLGIDRAGAREEMEREKVPYLISSECDCCPHKDLSRWLHTPDEVIIMLEEFEAQADDGRGHNFFFTPERVPLRQAIERMKAKALAKGLDPFEDASDFGCGNGVCGV